MSSALHQRAFSEPEEREDPRNGLLDVMTRQLVDMIDSARRNDVLALLLRRIETEAPALFLALQPAIPVLAAPVTSSAPGDSPAGSRPPGADPLEVAAVLTTLKLADSFRMSREHRALFDAARVIVTRWLDAARSARRLACDAPPRLPGTVGLWDHDAGSGA